MSLCDGHHGSTTLRRRTDPSLARTRRSTGAGLGKGASIFESES